jgi:cytochrome c oxidase subunit 2
MKLRRAPLAIFLGAADSAFAAARSVVDPATREASHIASLWWIFFGVCAVVYGLVLIWLLIAISRARRNAPAPLGERPPFPLVPASEPRTTRIVTSLVIATVLTLVVLLVVDFSTDRALRPPETGQGLTITIIGHQWWWQIEYEDREPTNIIHTANELHLPLGRPVQLILKSTDVIHSFWIPNLQGKKDLIPGHPTSLWLRPDRLGTFYGQCAEFCGLEHAKMGLVAVIESPEAFAKWQEAQRKSAVEPTTESQKHGQQVFLTRTCVLCHAIQGTVANSYVGPPLTHLASRQTIAAGSFPNTRGHLGGWILDAQALKPGVRMPPNQLGSDDLQALLDYLEILQ